MTSAETMSEQDTRSTTVDRSSLIVREHFVASLVFLLAGLVMLLMAAAALAWPRTTASLGLGEFLSYGRAMPAALNALVFGWLTLGLLAVTYHAIRRLLDTEIASPRLALAGGFLIAAGTAAGVTAIVLGEGAGGRLLEMPWFADAALVVGFVTTAVAVSMTVARSGAESVPVPVWYFLAAPWWLFLSYTAGAVPGLQGAPAEIQSAFTATAIYGMWLAPAVVGGGYHLIASRVPDAAFHPRLGRIGFWSLGFTWVWTAARTLQYGPTPDWMETVPVLFAAGLLVAVVTIAADFAIAVQGRWDSIAGSLSLRLYALGMGLLLLVPAHMLLQSFRSSSSVVRFTGWESAFEYLTLGAFTLCTAGLLLSFRRSSGRAMPGWAVATPITAGLLLAVGAKWIAGLQQGYAWLGGVESGTHDNFAEGFVDSSVAQIQGLEALSFIGLAVAAVGLLLYVVLSVAGRSDGAGPESELDQEWPDTERPTAIRRGAVAVFVLAAVAVLLLPAYESNVEPTLLADESRFLEPGSPGELGRDLYIAEGCWYCHTQQVRAVVTDVGLGPVSALGDYAHDPAGTFGVARIGPDLAHAGSRAPTDSTAWIADHLRDPRAERAWSNMPAYDHLSEGQLAALAVYVAGLE